MLVKNEFDQIYSANGASGMNVGLIMDMFKRYPAAPTYVLTTLAQQASYLSSLSTVPTASATIRAILAVPHSSIAITNFTFEAPTKSNAGTLQIVGTAGTREALRAYNVALQAVPFVASTDLPIGDYAQATNISFTDTLTLSYK